ncbi:MAG: phage baseplate assembly protein [Elusimicrobiales bacterium]
MSDKITLLVDGRELERFNSYSVDADFYLAADAFQLEVNSILPKGLAGQRVQLLVNGKRELDGVLDSPRRTWEKGKLSTKLSGRDLAGLLVDSHTDGYGDIKNVTLQGLAEKLIAKVPFIQRSDIRYNFTKDTPSLTWESVYVEPCKSIFEVLSEKAKALGLVFYAMPDGKFFFGKANKTGKPKFHITVRQDGRGNNALFGDHMEDISKRYSDLNVISNGQGTDAKATSQLTVAHHLADKTFPFYKPFYAIESSGGLTPARQARLIMDMQRRQGESLVYRVPGHSQGDKNWAINETCTVEDEILDLHGTYFIYGRRFVMSKEDGAYTELRLGLPGEA